MSKQMAVFVRFIAVTTLGIGVLSVFTSSAYADEAHIYAGSRSLARSSSLSAANIIFTSMLSGITFAKARATYRALSSGISRASRRQPRVEPFTP